MAAGRKRRIRASSNTTRSAVRLPARIADMEAMLAHLQRASAKTLFVAEGEIRSGDLKRIQQICLVLRGAVRVFMCQRHAMPPKLRRVLWPHIRAMIARLRTAEHAERCALDESAEIQHVVH